MTCRTAATSSLQHDVSILLYMRAYLDNPLLEGNHRVDDAYVLTSLRGRDRECVNDDSDTVASRRHHQVVCGRKRKLGLSS